jgi:2Fe-2S ferredoxin
MTKLKFLPSNIETECVANESIFEAAERVGVEIDNDCSGNGVCGRCVVKIISGEELLNPPTNIEFVHMGNVAYITHKRLSCQCKLIKDGEAVIQSE